MCPLGSWASLWKRGIEMPELFEAGDVVQLKSGGPRMTARPGDRDVYFCQWFGGGKKLESAYFHAVSLKKPDEEDAR